MNKDLSYEELLNQYRELQLRVTRFSVVEQQLINTRDRLDHELVMYKRLSHFNVNALSEISDCSFFRSVSEAIVDIFEFEVGITFRTTMPAWNEGFLTLEGLNLDNSEKSILIGEIESLCKQSESNIPVEISESDPLDFPMLKNYCGGIFYQKTDFETNETIVFFGLVSKQNAPFYQPIGEKHLSFFNVFSHHVLNIISNRRKSERIQEHITRISNTKLELKKLSLIATQTKNGVIITDSYGRIEWVNDAFTKICGYKLPEVIGKKPKDFLQKAGVDDDIQEQISSALLERKSIEVTIRNFTKSGDVYYNNLHLTPIFNEEGELMNFVGIQRDITEEFTIKQELLHVNSKYELITTRANIGIWEWNAKSNETYWNQVLIDQFGFGDSSDFAQVWRYSVIEEDYDSVKLALINLYHGSSDQEDLEYTIVRKSDGVLRNFKSLTIAERDDNGSLQRLVGNVIDVTDIRKWQSDVLRKNEELKKINAELDNFVYRVSHDLRSPLLAIKGIFSLIFSGNGIDEETKEYLNLADASVNRLDDTIQEILEYSRNSRLDVKLESFNVTDIIQDIYNDLKFSTEKDVNFKINIDGDSVIYSDKARFKVLFKNLIGNSFKYRKKNSKDAFVHFEMKHIGTEITIKVIDNGEGISKHSIGKVFNMFYRGTSTSVGTGLGLYICKEVLANLNGNIEVESELGRGTTMTVSLPVVFNI